MSEPEFSARPLAFLVMALILPIFAVAPLLYPGYFELHSGFVPLWNLHQWRAVPLNLGWLPTLATHFDPLRSDGLLPYYLTGFLPLSPPSAVKLVMGGAWLAGSLGIFLWLKSWLGNAGALVSAVVYTYLPFQIATVYVRGAWGEALFWGLLPWLILTATFLVTSPKYILLLPAAFFWLLGGLSQLGLTLWALLFVIALLLIVHPRQAFLPIVGAALGVIGALTFYGIIGAFGNAPPPVAFDQHFLYPFQLFSAWWEFGSSRPGWDDGLSLQLGLAALGLSMLTFFLWTRSQPAESPLAVRLDRRLLFFSGAPLVLALLSLGVAGPLWGIIPRLANMLTYPWQLLGFAGLCLAVLAGVALWLEPALTRRPLFSAVIIFVVLSSYPYLEPRFTQVDPAHLSGPVALLGDNQLALLNYDFMVEISNSTAGLNQGSAEIPLTVYGPLSAGNDLLLNVRWQPLTLFEQSYKIFVHLVDGQGNVLTQYDGYPQRGDYPTVRWIPGETITDAYVLTLPADPPPGPYRVYLGLYRETDFVRLSVPGDAEGRVILAVP